VKESHPGFPWVKLGKDNESVLRDNGLIVRRAVKDRLRKIMAVGPLIFSLTGAQLVQDGLADPVKVFIKNEPHGIKKVQEGRYRIISSVSLVDQIITRMLCAAQNKAEIAMWERCPSAPGIGLHDEGLSVIWEHAKAMAKSGTVCETDVSGWDWSVQQWELEMDADIRAELADGVESDFHFLLRYHAHCVGNAVFAMPDGELLEQIVPGGQLSGDYNTSSTNSRCRIIATLAARIRVGCEDEDFPLMGIKAMGDDSYELWFDGLSEGLQEIGHVVKMCEKRRGLEIFNFCSQTFFEGGACPENFGKTLFRYLSHNPKDPNYPMYRAQFEWTMRHLPPDQYRRIKRVVDSRVESGVKLS